MKRKNLIKLLVDTIYRDNIYLITPIIDWDLMDIVNINISEIIITKCYLFY